MYKIIEKYLPITLSILGASMIYFCEVKSISNIKDIITSIINFIAILSGFFTTMLSILVTSTDKPIMKSIQKSGRLSELFFYIANPIIIGFLDIGICLICLSFITDGCILYKIKTFYITMFFTMLFSLSSIRSIIILTIIMKSQIDPPTESEREINLENAFKNDN